MKLRVLAATEAEAWDKASKRVMKMQGGVHCMDIDVLGVIND